MKQNEIKRPSAFKTKLEVWRFLIQSTHAIPTMHHLNMVELKGCGKKAFTRYLDKEHKLDNPAILLMTKSGKSQTLPIFLEHYQYKILAPEIMDALAKKLGILTLLKNGFAITPQQLQQLISKNDVKTLKTYMDTFEFGDGTEASLLNMKNVELAKLYLEKNRVFRCNSDIILQYDNVEVYRAFGKFNDFTERIATEIIKHKRTEIVEILLEERVILSEENVERLIDRNDANLFKLYFASHSLVSEEEAYLAKHGSDELFEAYIKKANFDDGNTPELYDRLFEAKHRDLLKAHLQEYRVPEDVELKLLQSGDKELIDTYLQGDFQLCPKTMAWLMENDSDKRVPNLLRNSPSIGYYAEAKLFQNSDSEKIKAYLENNELSAFSEAMLFKYASLDILSDYLPDKALDIYAFRALALRHDRTLLQQWLNDNSGFDPEMLVCFLQHADTDILLDFFKQQLEEEGKLKFADDWDDKDYGYGEIIFKRNDEALSRFFVENGTLTSADEVALVKYAPQEMFFIYLGRNEPEKDAEVELIRNGDAEFVKEYLAKITYSLSEEGETELLYRLDEELVKFYEDKEGFALQSVLEI